MKGKLYITFVSTTLIFVKTQKKRNWYIRLGAMVPLADTDTSNLKHDSFWSEVKK